MRLERTSPAYASTLRSSLTVGWLRPSFSASRAPHTPSSTRSPSTWGGKLAVGSLSHSRICSRRSLASARIATTTDIAGGSALEVDGRRVAAADDHRDPLAVGGTVLAGGEGGEGRGAARFGDDAKLLPKRRLRGADRIVAHELDALHETLRDRKR